MKKHLERALPRSDYRATELSSDLAHRIASLIGTAEKRVTEIPGLSLHRRTAPTDLCPATYEPSVTVVAQGRKHVRLGQNTFIYDRSRYLLTSVDLPVVSRVVEATEETPCLVLFLKLEMAAIRELLSLEEIHVESASADALAMATGEATPEFLDACSRLMALLETPRDIPFLGGMIQREIICRVLQGNAGARLRAIATLGDHHQRTAKAIAWIKASYAKPVRVEDLAQIAGMSVSTFHHYFRVLTAMSPLQYQKRLRLQAARGRMLLDGLDAASAASVETQTAKSTDDALSEPKGGHVRGARAIGSEGRKMMRQLILPIILVNMVGYKLTTRLDAAPPAFRTRRTASMQGSSVCFRLVLAHSTDKNSVPAFHIGLPARVRRRGTAGLGLSEQASYQRATEGTADQIRISGQRPFAWSLNPAGEMCPRCLAT